MDTFDEFERQQRFFDLIQHVDVAGTGSSHRSNCWQRRDSDQGIV
jgi:hypothetical protein